MKEVNIYRQELDYSANESYKSLRTNLLFCGEDKKVIAVTSCTPNEGKSTVLLYLWQIQEKKFFLLMLTFVNLCLWDVQK